MLRHQLNERRRLVVNPLVAVLDVRWHRVHVEHRRQSPAHGAHVQEAVIAQMVIGVGDEHREHDAPPQFGQILRRSSSMRPQRIRNLRVAPPLPVHCAEHAHGGEVWNATHSVVGHLAVEAGDEQHIVVGDAIQAGLCRTKTGLAGELQSHGLPRDDPVVVLVPLGKLGDQQGAARVADGRFRTGTAQRRPPGRAGGADPRRFPGRPDIDQMRRAAPGARRGGGTPAGPSGATNGPPSESARRSAPCRTLSVTPNRKSTSRRARGARFSALA